MKKILRFSNLKLKAVYSTLLFLLILQISCIRPHQNTINALFISWNTETLNALQKEAQQSKNERAKVYAQSRAESLQRYWQVSTDSLNRASIRYEFIAKILAFKSNSDFYIVEATKSGERVTIQNYVIYQRKNSTEIYRFEYVLNKGWQLAEQFKIKGKIEINPYSYYTQYGHGINSDDVILTHFSNNQILESHYYMQSCMRNFSLIFDF